MRAAGDLLSNLRAPKRGESDLYRQTGLVEVQNTEAWQAFVTFAPYAFDATVWLTSGGSVDLSDCGQSLVASLTPDQAAAIGEQVGGDRVMPR